MQARSLKYLPARDDLPGKQGLARGRPLATYVRCDVTSGVERETGIEPVLPAWKEQAHHAGRANC